MKDQKKPAAAPAKSIFDEDLPPVTPETDLEPVPADVLMEEAIARQAGARARSLMARANMEPKEIDNILSNRETILNRVRHAVIKGSKPHDWTLWKGPEGEIVATPRDSLTSRAKKLYGITIFNYRPLGKNGAEAQVVKTDEFVTEKDYKTGDTVRKKHNGHDIPVYEAKMWADGFCELTGEPLPDQTFTSRTGRFAGQEAFTSDLVQSCRTGLDKLIVSKLSELRKVSGDELATITGGGKEFLAKCYKGSGFGSSAERKTGALADDDVKTAGAALGNDIMRRVAGDATAAKDLLREITAWKAKDGKQMPGFDTVTKFTQMFQIENAVKKLKVHPQWGDSAVGASSPDAAPAEPGAQG